MRREMFIPARVWVDDEEADLPVPLERDTDPDRWRLAVEADQPILTQFDDGATRWPDATGRHCTCSASQPSLMLETLDVQPGQRVLEIGTGTGYNAALLAHRVGGQNVVTVEVDQELAEQARNALKVAGFDTVSVITRDGELGFAEGAPYDRVIATVAVGLGRLPSAWVAQTRPGGVIVTPVRADYAAGSALPLHRGRRRHRHRVSGGPGRIHAPAAAPQQPRRARRPGRSRPRREGQPHRGRAVAGANSWDVRWAISTRVPSCRWDHDETDGQHTLWLVDVESRSWAAANYDDAGASPYEVCQHGPRRLWDEVEASYRWWVDAGSPTADRWRFTVSAEGQRVELE